MALFALLTITLATLSVGLLCTRHSKLAPFFPHLIAFGTGCLLVACMTEFLPHIQWGIHATGAHPAQALFSAPFFILLGILLVVVADKYIAPFFLTAQIQDLGTQQMQDLQKPNTQPLNAHDTKLQQNSTAHCHEHHSSRHAGFFIPPGAACSSIGCIVVCAFFDGFEIVAAFSIETATGWFVSAAFLLHTIPESVMAAGLGLQKSKRAALISVALVSGAIWLGGVCMLSLQQWAARETLLLPLATGVLLYTLLTHLLPAALKGRGAGFCLLLGVAVAYVL